MSTSPSWFDQEKFSRLVKKVGPKPVTEALPGQPGAEAENRPLPGEGAAPTARISLVSKPPSLMSEGRALPALPRRTAPMPSLKTLFSHPPLSTETVSSDDSGEKVKEETAAPAGEAAHDDDDASFAQEGEGLTAAWQKMGQLNEELAYTIKDRDQAVKESDLLREELHQARREYADLRKEFEALKQDQTPREASGKLRKELEQQLEGFRQKLEERNREIAALKANPGGAAGGDGGGDGDEKLKQEVASFREQLARAKEEASIAQRGLALSQKALQETRDTLREATEGTSLSRHNFDNLKNECANLSQQNAVLQAQNDQLSRDLAAAKSKLTTRV